MVSNVQNIWNDSQCLLLKEQNILLPIPKVFDCIADCKRNKQLDPT